MGYNKTEFTSIVTKGTTGHEVYINASFLNGNSAIHKYYPESVTLKELLAGRNEIYREICYVHRGYVRVYWFNPVSVNNHNYIYQFHGNGGYRIWFSHAPSSWPHKTVDIKPTDGYGHKRTLERCVRIVNNYLAIISSVLDEFNVIMSEEFIKDAEMELATLTPVISPPSKEYKDQVYDRIFQEMYGSPYEVYHNIMATN